jgi:hypothetical protein
LAAPGAVFDVNPHRAGAENRSGRHAGP